MIKNKMCYGLFVALMMVSLVAAAAGCITVYEKKPSDSTPGTASTPAAGGAPVIKSFTVTPKTLNAGQQAQLQWEVTGATSVEINPAVGKVSQSDTVLVSPTATTTYTLAATNAAGSKTATVVVTVAGAAASGRPDLVVTDIYLITKEVYYTAKNIGKAAAKGSRTYLYVNDIKVADDYLEALEPGQERTGPFKNYAWVYNTTTPTNPLAPIQWTVKVCVDIENIVVESDEANNCRSGIWGEKLSYPFMNYYHQALWTSGYGVITVPMSEDNANGAVLLNSVANEENKGSGGLLTIPQQVPNGYIMGRFGEFYTDELRQSRVRDIIMLDLARFSAYVGFANTSPPQSKAKFTFGTVDSSGVVTYFPSVTASYDGKLDLYEVDLSSQAGQKRSFVLRVEAVDATQKLRPIWIDPRIYQP